MGDGHRRRVPAPAEARASPDASSQTPAECLRQRYPRIEHAPNVAVRILMTALTRYTALSMETV